MNNSEVVRSVSESLQRLGELAPRYNEELVAAAETVSRVETFLARVGIDLFTEVSLHEDGGGCQVWDGDTELEEVTTLSVAFVHGTPRICVNLKFYQLATFESTVSTSKAGRPTTTARIRKMRAHRCGWKPGLGGSAAGRPS
jgi:hypothetical protein